MESLSRIAGTPVPIPMLRTLLKQPDIKTIASLGEDNFSSATSLLQLDKDMYVKSILEKVEEENKQEVGFELSIKYPSNLAVFLDILTGDDAYFDRINLETFLHIIFPELDSIVWSPPMGFQLVLVNSRGEKNPVMIMEDNFEEFREDIGECFRIDSGSDTSEYNPLGEEASRIANLIEEAKQKRNQNKPKETTKTSAIGTLCSILATGDGISLLEVLNLTLPQLIIQSSRTIDLKDYTTQITLGAFAGLKDTEISDWRKPV